MIWYKKTNHLDIETGEIIRKNNLKNYIKIKTNKHVTVNKNNTVGNIEYTIEYRKNPQINLFDNK